MSFRPSSILCLAAVAAACSLTGCGQTDNREGATYTAARHMRTGSNVPQATDANSTNSVYKPAAGEESIGGTAVNPRDGR